MMMMSMMKMCRHQEKKPGKITVELGLELGLIRYGTVRYEE